MSVPVTTQTYLDSLQDERNSATLYAGLAALEKNPQLAAAAVTYGIGRLIGVSIGG